MPSETNKDTHIERMPIRKSRENETDGNTGSRRPWRSRCGDDIT